VREDQLMVPIGYPIEPLAGEAPPINDLLYETCQQILAELREIKALLRPYRSRSRSHVTKPGQM
jgi:hypothetical protein